MYRKPFLATTYSSARRLEKLSLTGLELYNPLYELFRSFVDEHKGIKELDINKNSRDVLDSLINRSREIINDDSHRRGTKKVILSADFLQKHPKGNYLSNDIYVNNYEIAVLNPLGGFVIWMNATASKVWRLCNGDNTVGQIIDILQKYFPDEKENTLRSDAIALLVTLENLGLIEMR